MAEIRPFRGLRYRAREIDLAAVTAPPYDIISPKQQEEYYERDQHNIIRIELPKDVPGDATGEAKYDRAGRTLRAWVEEGVLIQDQAPSVYVYDQEFQFGNRVLRRRGLIARVRLEEWSKRVVLPHEVTMAGPKKDRLQLMRATHTNVSPLFALFDDSMAEIASLLAETARGVPVAEFRDDEGHRHVLQLETHRERLAAITRLFEERPLYIADGHHRYETAIAYRDEQRRLHPDAPGDAGFNYVMMLLVDVADPGLVLLPTHRLVGSIPSDRLSRFLESIDRSFVVEQRTFRSPSDLPAMLTALEALGQQQKQAFGMYGPEPDRFRFLVRRNPTAEVESPAARLDVTLLHRDILQSELGVADHERRGQHGYLDYTRDAAEALEAVQRGDYQLAFFLNPPPVTAVRDVALAGETMPEKSTYFYPKPITGLVLNPLEPLTDKLS